MRYRDNTMRGPAAGRRLLFQCAMRTKVMIKKMCAVRNASRPKMNIFPGINGSSASSTSPVAEASSAMRSVVALRPPIITRNTPSTITGTIFTNASTAMGLRISPSRSTVAKQRNSASSISVTVRCRLARMRRLTH